MYLLYLAVCLCLSGNGQGHRVQQPSNGGSGLGIDSALVPVEKLEGRVAPVPTVLMLSEWALWLVLA